MVNSWFAASFQVCLILVSVFGRKKGVGWIFGSPAQEQPEEAGSHFTYTSLRKPGEGREIEGEMCCRVALAAILLFFCCRVLSLGHPGPASQWTAQCCRRTHDAVHNGGNEVVVTLIRKISFNERKRKMHKERASVTVLIIHLSLGWCM